MNIRPTPGEDPLRPRRLLRPRRSDMEFLAPALEILETPPSPVRIALILIICFMAASSLAWAYFGRIEIIATAQGKIEPLGRVKTIEPLQTGRVSEILVHDGDVVVAGQIVAELEATELTAVTEALVQQLSAAQATILRCRAAIDLLETGSREAELVAAAVDWPDEIPIEIAQREHRVLKHDLAELAAELGGIDTQIDQQRANARSIATTIGARQSLIETLQELVTMRETLVDSGTVSRADLLETIQALQVEKVALTIEARNQADTNGVIAVLQTQRATMIRTFLAGYAQQLSEAEARVDDLAQRVTQAQSQLSQMTLRSPIDGVVLASTLTTIGQVVTTGQEVMRVVPADAAIEVQAFLTNGDIGFVHLGQEASVKVDAFPYTRYGTVSAKIVRIGKDAISSAVAQRSLADATSVSESAPASGDTSLVFPILVELETDHIQVGEGSVRLSPGMAVTVDINTGTRSILQFVLAPLVEVSSSAMRER